MIHNQTPTIVLTTIALVAVVGKIVGVDGEIVTAEEDDVAPSTMEMVMVIFLAAREILFLGLFTSQCNVASSHSEFFG